MCCVWFFVSIRFASIEYWRCGGKYCLSPVKIFLCASPKCDRVVWRMDSWNSRACECDVWWWQTFDWWKSRCLMIARGMVSASGWFQSSLENKMPCVSIGLLFVHYRHHLDSHHLAPNNGCFPLDNGFTVMANHFPAHLQFRLPAGRWQNPIQPRLRRR